MILPCVLIEMNVWKCGTKHPTGWIFISTKERKEENKKVTKEARKQANTNREACVRRVALRAARGPSHPSRPLSLHLNISLAQCVCVYYTPHIQTSFIIQYSINIQLVSFTPWPWSGPPLLKCNDVMIVWWLWVDVIYWAHTGDSRPVLLGCCGRTLTVVWTGHTLVLFGCIGCTRDCWLFRRDRRSAGRLFYKHTKTQNKPLYIYN